VISLNNISKHYGGDWLFHRATLRIGDNERIAIVGPNGAGKSTIMKIIVGLVEADEGDIAQSRTNTVGYLPQDGVHHVGKTLFEEASTAFEDILALHDRVDGLSAEISQLSNEVAPDDRRLLVKIDELGEVQHLLEHREGYNIQTRVAQVLAGLGFRERDFGRQTAEFSGGWQMRIALAKLLLREPTILLLDEPTNHLDIESLEWLEQYLMEYEHSLVLISHDRRFLDTLVNRTIEISMGKLTEYSGNFSYYIDEKVLRMEQLRAEYENQQQHIKQTQRFIERFRYKNTKARQVQSRVKMLEKMELIELEDEEGGISFDFPEPPQPGRILMELRGIHKNYGSLQVFDGLEMTIERGDRIAFLGVNGIGKSTLARIIAGVEDFQGGERTPGHNCSIAYYAQNQAEELDAGKTVLQTLDDIAAGEVRKRLRTLLGCFMFSGDAVDKKVAVLSGGEKSRLALAKMLLTPSNFLILDEPTNHLDMRSKAVLQDALSRFEGSYIIVSHDRDFLEPLINKCVDFRDGHARETMGTVSDYLRKRHAEQENARQRDSAGRMVLKKGATHRERDRKREEAEQRQERYRKSKPLKNELSRLEKRIEEMEGSKLEVEHRLADEATYRDQEKARELTATYQKLQDELAGLYSKWEEIQLQLEELNAEGNGQD
jgi:ATP-binding cassette subfamily F protein 3